MNPRVSPGGDPRAQERRARWMILGIGLNAVASLTAIGLWVATSRGAARGAPAGAEPEQAAPSRPLPIAPPARAFLPGAAAAPPVERSDGAAKIASRVQPIRLGKRSGSPVPASVATLAGKLQLNPQVLTDQLGDARGEVPGPAVERLERAQAAGNAFARRLDLDESRSRSVVAMFTSHAFNVLREEKTAAPDRVDPARIDEIAEETTRDIRAICGADASSELAAL